VQSRRDIGKKDTINPYIFPSTAHWKKEDFDRTGKNRADNTYKTMPAKPGRWHNCNVM